MKPAQSFEHNISRLCTRPCASAKPAARLECSVRIESIERLGIEEGRITIALLESSTPIESIEWLRTEEGRITIALLESIARTIFPE
jgi:hypothetical protein